MSIEVKATWRLCVWKIYTKKCDIKVKKEASHSFTSVFLQTAFLWVFTLDVWEKHGDSCFFPEEGNVENRQKCSVSKPR
jgi:hypothetical protein